MGDTRGGTRSLGHPHRDPPDTPLWPLERVEALGLAQERSCPCACPSDPYSQSIRCPVSLSSWIFFRRPSYLSPPPAVCAERTSSLRQHGCCLLPASIQRRGFSAFCSPRGSPGAAPVALLLLLSCTDPAVSAGTHPHPSSRVPDRFLSALHASHCFVMPFPARCFNYFLKNEIK